MHLANQIFPVLAIALLSLGSCTNSANNTASTAAAPPQELASATAGGAQAALDADKAQTQFNTYCSGCHGDNAITFADRRWKYGSSREEIFTSIKKGIPAAGMPAFAATFSDAEIENLVTYIKEGIQSVEAYSFKEQQAAQETYESEGQTIKLETVVSGIGVPWGLAFLPDGGMLVTERSGKFYRVSENRELQPVQGVPAVRAEGQSGLMDVALHPNFSKNNIIYLSYSAIKQQDGKTLSTTAIMRARLDGNQLTDQKVIFEAQPYSETRHHYGSRMVFGKDGYLYFSVGERGNEKENPQTLDRHLGKIHRIKDDGSIPADNPFVNRQGALPSIYSYGHRNPQGLAFHPATGELWSHEHGPRGGDEVNIVKPARNYGWPVVSYGINYNGQPITDKTQQAGVEDPIWYWTPSIAPSGMAFVTGNRYKGWEGDVMVGSLRFKFLSRCKIENGKIVREEKLLPNIGRVREVRMSPDGYLYIGVETGHVYKLVPVAKP
ncbi:PQQ-dependent sugar dehydrogenase [Pontibacter qinzhouensis]|uniref:PQQ-dependent sugar dehydrogenase n=1 Tax=Pontibacter qinzhouensis TaxID=2603253 RepID=A0A5C8JLG7_9BACT|nr:PQQ-dependent sugar dehydrogenase [Pontibacter qinzhouensis]TXK37876.1 PQQ-dependent sugar dehydrogenase [Pontibacter qinzhouensis]